MRHREPDAVRGAGGNDADLNPGHIRPDLNLYGTVPRGPDGQPQQVPQSRTEGIVANRNGRQFPDDQSEFDPPLAGGFRTGLQHPQGCARDIKHRLFPTHRMFSCNRLCAIIVNEFKQPFNSPVLGNSRACLNGKPGRAILAGMKFGRFILLFASCASLGDTFASDAPLQTADDVFDARQGTEALGKAFDITGRVYYYYPTESDGWEITLNTDRGPIEFFGGASFIEAGDNPPQFGLMDELRLQGEIGLINGKTFPLFSSIKVLSKGDIGQIPPLTPLGIYAPESLGGLFQLRGIVREASIDDSDANFIHLAIADGDGQAQVMVIQPAFLPNEFRHLIGAEVIARGHCSDNACGLRRYVGRLLAVAGLENIEVITPPKGFDDAPELLTLVHALPQTIAGSGQHRVEGTVLATWNGNTFLMKTAGGHVVQVRLQGGGLPECGSSVRALGLPVTDYYHINLIHATWQASSAAPIPADTPRETTPRDLLINDKGLPQLMMRHHGRTIRLTGIVRYLPDPEDKTTDLQIESEGHLVTIRTSSATDILNGLEIGCLVGITGICVMQAEDWRIDSTDRQPPDFFLVPRTAGDLEVLSRPSWWTPRRLLGFFIVSLSALLGLVFWNISLNHRARRKGRELANVQMARLTSELKVGERTRLAVELHDALSQTLTGVSMQIDTASDLAKGKEPSLTRCLDLASRTIDSCRLELRNTLWDLRSEALDEPDFNTAIRKTLRQNLSGVDLSVRFNVSRGVFPDDTVHAVLKIIRELATNALRHGKATSLQIAGTLEDDRLKFSVRDNGCGFDPDLAPGIAQGHFGLQGITERLCRLDGEIVVKSEIGRGTRVSITIPLPTAG